MVCREHMTGDDSDDRRAVVEQTERMREARTGQVGPEGVRIERCRKKWGPEGMGPDWPDWQDWPDGWRRHEAVNRTCRARKEPGTRVIRGVNAPGAIGQA